MWLELAGLLPVVINNFSGGPGPAEFSHNQRPRALLTCTKKWRQPRCRLQAFRPCRAPINRFFKPQVFPGKYLVVERTCSYIKIISKLPENHRQHFNCHFCFCSSDRCCPAAPLEPRPQPHPLSFPPRACPVFLPPAAPHSNQVPALPTSWVM